MKKLFFIIISFVSVTGWSQEIILTDEARISVITCGPGQDEVFTAFGHNAFRVSDPAYGIDVVYHYGVFIFDQPNFYLNFARGHNLYSIGVMDFKNFENYYVHYNRYLHEQILNLSTGQKQKLFEFLQWNALPENQYYLYDYFYDNCATKIPEVMLRVFGDSVVFDGSYIKTEYSIRDLTDLYLTYQPWGDLGIDICLGLPMDKIATPYEYMFIPDYVESGFDHATINGVPLVKEKIVLYESKPQSFENGLFQPLYLFSFFGLLVLLITLYDFKRNKKSNWFDFLLFGFFGGLGLLLLLLWVATDHKAAANNMNLLWALPTHFIIAFAVFKPRLWMKKYFIAVLLINVLLLITWPWLPQMLHYSLVPIVLAISLRAFARIKIA